MAGPRCGTCEAAEMGKGGAGAEAGKGIQMRERAAAVVLERDESYAVSHVRSVFFSRWFFLSRVGLRGRTRLTRRLHMHS